MHPFHMSTTGMMTTGGLLLVEASYIPQILRLYRMKEAHEFHLVYPSLNLLGRLIVLAAGIISHSAALTFGFGLGVLIRLTLLFQVVYYRAQEAKRARMQLEQVSV
jgi:hypothetical protein